MSHRVLKLCSTTKEGVCVCGGCECKSCLALRLYLPDEETVSTSSCCPSASPRQILFVWWRLFMALVMTVGLISSLVFSDDDVDIYLTYWTNWTFIFEWFTVVILLLQAIHFQRSPSERARLFLSKVSKWTAIMLEMAVPVAFLVPIAYWSLLGCTAHCYWADGVTRPFPSLTEGLTPSDELPTGIEHTTTSSDSSYFYCAKSACESWSTFLVHLINGVLLVTELLLNNIRFLPSHSLFVFLHFIIWLTIAIVYQAISGESIYGWITSFETPATVTAFAVGIVILVVVSHQLWVVVSWFCRRNRHKWSRKLAKLQRSRPELEGHEMQDKEYEQSTESSDAEESEDQQRKEESSTSTSRSRSESSSRSTSEIEIKKPKSEKKPRKSSSSAPASSPSSSSNWEEEKSSDAIQTM